MDIRDYPKNYKDTAFYYFITILLAAKNVGDAIEIANSIFSESERLSIGRRLEIAYYLGEGKTSTEIIEMLKTSKDTVSKVSNLYNKSTQPFENLIKKHSNIKNEYKNNKYIKKEGSILAFKYTEETDFSFKDVKRS
ncbi:hypothetical protein COV24_00050 [candidate division WWE3 bacterium CG10_big_fil_rev_8_21_14_0_10_32_10]|uniref:Uncharacterized protein n=1 Tax=candidate division WWE3 bacterium CG10_big_fil_rev_8_21_14_0_10_32_10 TaxID=1975090 RepID=A0A2H0RBP8_UNCKA|nr:MAG: hypothetical protein COV24_00050 [candidate division WWE3 bacterium CG10_big_fil_rev_8_21_14_0_10_32_10]